MKKEQFMGVSKIVKKVITVLCALGHFVLKIFGDKYFKSLSGKKYSTKT